MLDSLNPAIRWLATCVLLVALLGSRGLRPTPEEEPVPWPLLTAWSRLLVPLLTLFGGYLLWRGGNWPGGLYDHPGAP